MSKEPSTAISSAPTAATTNGAAARTAGEVPVAPRLRGPEPWPRVGRARYRSPGARSSCFGALGGGEPSSSLIVRSYALGIGTVSSPTVTHPSLGLPPSSLTTGFPEAAERLRTQGRRLATRAVEVAANEDPTYADRIGEAGLRNLLEDATCSSTAWRCVWPATTRTGCASSPTRPRPSTAGAGSRSTTSSGCSRASGRASAACSPRTRSRRRMPRSTTHRRVPLASPARRRRAQAEPDHRRHLQGRLSSAPMTIDREG